MRPIWHGVVSFGLVAVPVRLYAATSSHDVRFHQVHATDGGRLRYRRFCESCGAEVAYEEIVKGHETDDGELVTIDEDDLAGLPTHTTREIAVVEFVPADQIDPLLLDRSYYLEPDAQAVKPYTLLREVLQQADQVAVAKVTLRQRETLALLRVRAKIIVLQTMLWPDEVREPDFPLLRAETPVSDLELQMADTLAATLSTDFDPSRYHDEYTQALRDLIDHKRHQGAPRPAAAPEPVGDPGADLLTALRRSVEEAARRSPSTDGDGAPRDTQGDQPRQPDQRQ